MAGLLEVVVGFWRDANGRLTFDLPGVAATDYPAVCRNIAAALNLAPAGDIIVGPEQIFWDFRQGERVVGLDWDTWMEFMAVAKSEASDPLVRDIAAWLNSARRAGPAGEWGCLATEGAPDAL